MHVIATAGHVDHGKTTLIKALTGIDADRLEEEKRRGLTIDLGFAWISLNDGPKVGIVDVPGHERFIKNMLAGMGAIDVVMFVVAANEGWKPQSQEHLDIIDLLGISSGVIVITKTDTVDAETLGRVEDQITDRLRGTTLEGAARCRVSATTGAGIDELRSSLAKALEAAGGAPDVARPRLWIDRVFSMKGSGTVVTGTLLGGSLARDEEVEVLPSGQRARIRSIESHNESHTRIAPGNRVALNLVGASLDGLHRGNVIARPGSFSKTARFLARLRLLPGVERKTVERGAFKVYIGSAEEDAAIRVLGEYNDDLLVSLSIEHDLPAVFGDRFVMREAGRRQTIGGGIVIEPRPPDSNTKALLETARARADTHTPQRYVEVLLEEQGHMRLDEIGARTELSVDNGLPGWAIRLGSFALHPKAYESLAESISKAVHEHHIAHPLDQGIAKLELRALVNAETTLIDEVVDKMLESGLLINLQGALAQPGHSAIVDSPDKQRLLAELQASGTSVPSLSSLRDRHGVDLVKALLKDGTLVQIDTDIAYEATWLEALKNTISDYVAANGSFTVADFRDLASTTRKYAVPLLEYLDRTGFTKRDGDLRSLRAG